MRDLTTCNMLFRFCESLGGQLGDMPSIEILQGEEIPPPLGKAFVIRVTNWHRDRPAASDLEVLWGVSKTGPWLRLYCQADDPWLKRQYKERPDLAEKVVNLLLLPEKRDLPEWRYRRHDIGATVTMEEIPEPLRAFVSQVEVWKTFFQKPELSKLRGNHYCSVTGEGYYKAYISACALRLGAPPYVPEQADDSEGWDPIPRGFDFNPKTEPPTVLDNAIYWELPEPKVLVILPHDSSNERVAVYYGYLEMFRKYAEGQREFEKRMSVASQANEAEDAAKQRKREAALRQALLPS